MRSQLFLIYLFSKGYLRTCSIKKGGHQERECQRIGRGIKQKESQDHGKEKSQITVMQGWESKTPRMGKVGRLQERFFYKMKLRMGNEIDIIVTHLNLFEIN